MGTMAANNRVQTVCRMFPLKTTPTPDLIELLEAASMAALEYNNLTPIGPPATGLRPTDDWVLDAWVKYGNDPSLLTEQTLIMFFPCVPNGSIN